MRGFVLNLRRPLMQDPALREALALAFDDAWIRRALFREQPQRTQSFFANSELAAAAASPPRTATATALKACNAAPKLFGPVAPPSTEKQDFRDSLLRAATLLKENGYVLKGERLFTNKGAPVRFEVILGDPVEEKIALTWARALERLGIVLQVRSLDSAQFQARLTSFAYDATVAHWVNSLSPGNEQTAYWGSLAARQPGSRNYAGFTDPTIDCLARVLPQSRDRAEMVAAARALDRALLAQRAVIPFFYKSADSIAYWPGAVTPPATTPLYGTVMEAWWSPALDSRLPN
jgi:microcin C transport system substrate-binding protein